MKNDEAYADARLHLEMLIAAHHAALRGSSDDAMIYEGLTASMAEILENLDDQLDGDSI
jgi:hypothetical protein